MCVCCVSVVCECVCLCVSVCVSRMSVDACDCVCVCRSLLSYHTLLLSATGKVWGCSALNGHPSDSPQGPSRSCFRCVVQCDVVNLPQYHKLEELASKDTPSTYFVVGEERHIRVRRLLVYRTHGSASDGKPGSGISTLGWVAIALVVCLLAVFWQLMFGKWRIRR